MGREHLPEANVHRIHANGLDLAYLEDGEGPLVVLAHGFPDTPHTWDELVPPLVQAGYRVVRPFGRGIAPSQKPDGDHYGVEVLAQDLISLIEALGEERATLIGHDWGAAAVWGAGHLAPDRIERMIVVAIPHPAELKPTLGKLWGARHFVGLRLPGAVARMTRKDFAAVRTFYERWSPGFDWPDSEFESAKNAYAYPGTVHAALGYYRCLGRWPFRGGIEVDTLILGGITDGVATEADFQASVSRINKTGEVRMLPGGHFLHREHPAPFEEAVLSYLGPGSRDA